MDLTESLIAFLQAALADSFPDDAVHVGEVIPQDYDGEFVWLGQSGESTTGDLCDDLDSISYDVEVVAGDIARCRALTRTVKTALRDAPNWDPAWNGLAQFAAVEDHEDSYTPRNPSADTTDHLHVGTLRVVMHLA